MFGLGSFLQTVEEPLMGAFRFDWTPGTACHSPATNSPATAAISQKVVTYGCAKTCGVDRVIGCRYRYGCDNISLVLFADELAESGLVIGGLITVTVSRSELRSPL